MGRLRLVGTLQLFVSFAKEPYKRDDILQKRTMVLRSLLIVATPYPSKRAYANVISALTRTSPCLSLLRYKTKKNTKNTLRPSTARMTQLSCRDSMRRWGEDINQKITKAITLQPSTARMPRVALSRLNSAMHRASAYVAPPTIKTTICYMCESMYVLI